ncbi:xanthine dehydrogenase family protein molybdopterin-binding subunit [Limnohabitans sp. Rim11]|uniref:xanthine dehydrogenase family protein molybdopterin-binding subunit n=1 Tax=Limnohabitans sp. Rim11 TaxID=1100719 RepID=UPI000B2D84F0|nr:molybdopterin cofactor-binding domain-containing protein [Limnohabitans sp. Rim11]
MKTSNTKHVSADEAGMGRRQFLKVSGTASAGMSLGFFVPGRAQAADTPQLNVWIEIEPNDTVVIRYARAEMGQGSMTSAPMMIAEELEADWKKVRVEYATAHENLRTKRAYGDMASVGSRTIRHSQEYMRKAGATAREMLITAAAQKWNVPASECKAALNKVTHTASKRSFTYGQLAADAAKLEAPKTVQLKDPKNWTIIGKSIPRVDIPDIVVGKRRYGIDTQLPGMLHAAVAACPVFNGTVKSMDASKVENRRGIVKILNLGGFVAVVADNWWRAKEALREVSVEWDVGEHGTLSSAAIMNHFKAGMSQPELAVARNDGNTLEALSKAAKVVEAEYFTPYLAHATMEPMVCTAWLQGDKLEVWSSTQNPEATLAVSAATAGVPPANVKVHPVQLGGGLGRKSPQDFTRQAVMIAKAMPGKPVKMLWSREEEIQHGLYRPASLMRFKAGLDANGKVDALHIRVSAPSILATLLKLPLPKGIDGQAVACFNDHPYAIPNTLVDYAQRNTNVPVGFWRTVGHSQNPFGRECFIDECAQAAGKDPVAFRLDMLPNNETSKRDRAILEAVTKAAGWGSQLPAGVFRGVAETEGYGSWTACVCEVSVNARNEVKIHRVVIGIDPGYAVNPDNIVAQFQGSVVHGLTAIFWGENTIKEGRVEQSNFHDYRMMRLNEMPKVEVVIAPTGGFWGGVGEPAQAPLAPALANAISAAMGKRIRSLPLKNHGLTLKA